MLNVCNLCELNKKSHIIIGEGPEDADIMLVGECPGPDEDKLKRPFIGKSGQLLRGALKNLGISEDSVFITNIVKCWPQPGLNPKERHIKACRGCLVRQIEDIKPKLIVTLGRFSSAFILNKDPEKLGITRISGKTIEKDGRHILPVVHPSYVLRNKGNKESAIEMLIHLSPMLEFINEEKT